jgi:hypothetical protein
MRCICPLCAAELNQDRNAEGLNYCTHCRSLFLIAPEKPIPTWILGVLTFLMANLQLLHWR